MNRLFLSFSLSFAILASCYERDHKTPEEIQKELDLAESQFENAKEMFNPWYTGPLLTPSATMMPPGYGNVQPYVFVNDNYAAYNKERKSLPLKNNLINLNPLAIIQAGLTDSMDLSVTVQTNTNWLDGRSGGGYGDTQAGVGFLIQPQTLYVPKMKFSITETFPTGKYQHLRSDGLDGAGSGSYQTQFSFAMGKIMFWATKHPLNARIALAYRVAAPLKVAGYNSYGGGIGAKGTVRPGNTFSADLGFELSLTQRWVFANDFVYTTTNKTRFSGFTGTTANGSSALVGKGYSDQLSLAPAIEYNWSDQLGILGGVQFTVYGRNSSNFIAGIISVEYTFPLN